MPPLDSLEVLPAPTFAALPAPRRGRSESRTRVEQFAPVIAALKAAPGQWAKVATFAGGAGTSVRRAIEDGRWGFTPAGAFKAHRRSHGDGTAALWVCYTPPAEPISDRAAATIIEFAELDRELRGRAIEAARALSPGAEPVGKPCPDAERGVTHQTHTWRARLGDPDSERRCPGHTPAAATPAPRPLAAHGGRAEQLKRLCTTEGCEHGYGRHGEEGCNRLGCPCLAFT